jgi:DNA-binding beta-propeller fold protein YncE
MRLGHGEFNYEAQEWPRLPPGQSIGDVGGVAVDSKDRIHVFARGERPVMVFDREGNLLRSWGEGYFRRPHGIDIGPDDSVYCTDDGDNTVRKFTPDGRLLLEIGIPGRAAPFMQGQPFNRCTHTALSPRGDIYVSDGYGNARIHKYSPDGKWLISWGGPGIAPGEFNVPHNLVSDADGQVYVADRENHRIQIFDGDGKFLTQWHGLHRPCALCASKGNSPTFFVGEVGPGLAVNREFPNLGPRVSVVGSSGSILARIGSEPAGLGLTQFVAPHGLAVDSRGDLYVGEVGRAAWPQLFPQTPMPDPLRTLRKLVRVPAQ